MKTLRKNFGSAVRSNTCIAKIVAELETKQNALKAGEVATLLGVTRQHVYKMAAQQTNPSFRVGGAVRVDPSQLAEWLRRKMPQPVSRFLKSVLRSRQRTPRSVGL